MSKVVRSVKNVTKGYTAAQVKVRNATSNDAWGPVGSDMAEIAQMTFAEYVLRQPRVMSIESITIKARLVGDDLMTDLEFSTATFYEIMDILDKRLNDKGKNWRHVLKSLKVLDYCLHEGSELVVTWARKNIYIIKTLREFQHIDDDARDVGLNIRVSAKELTSLILDEERLRMERRDRKSWKSRVQGLDDYDRPPPEAARPPRRQQRPQRADEDDLEYRLAIEASKNEAEEDAKRRAKNQGGADDDDLAKAIKLSKEEEELRRRELEQANANSLFDDAPGQQPAVAQPTGWNQGYQQQPAVDWFGQVIDPQQQQQTGYSVQPTGYQNTGYGGYGQQPFNNNTGMNNNAFMQPQQTAFNTNNSPYGQQNGGNSFGAFGQQPAQQQEPTPTSGSKNPFGANQQGNGPISVQQTGSNNPFAQSSPFGGNNSMQANKPPTLSSLSEQQASSSFNPITSYGSPTQQQQPNYLRSPTTSQAPSQSQIQPLQQQQQHQPLPQQQTHDPHKNRLNALLASQDGQDSFGNWGDSRIPGLQAQHTSPAFRAGPNANPFLNTHVTGGIQPAYTGPAGGYGGGGGGSNPFGAQQNAGHGRGQGGSNLIDL